jgi:hypothetical protein
MKINFLEFRYKIAFKNYVESIFLAKMFTHTISERGSRLRCELDSDATIEG